MNTARSDRSADIVVQPSNEVVLDIFWIQVHKIAGLGVLVIDLNSIRETDRFEGFVPVFDTLLHEATVTNRSSVFDVESDRRYRRANLQAWVSLFKSPSSHVANQFLVVQVTTQVGVVRDEVTNALICFTRPIAGVFRHFAERIVQRLQLAACSNHFKCKFDVLGERFGFGYFGELWILNSDAGAKKLGSVSDKQCVRIDQGTAARNHRNDWHVQQDGIGEQSFDGRLRFGFSVGTNIYVGQDQSQTLVVLTPVNVVVCGLEAGKLVATANGGGNKVLLGCEIFWQLEKHLPIFFAGPDSAKGSLVGRLRFGFGEPFRYFFEGWVILRGILSTCARPLHHA